MVKTRMLIASIMVVCGICVFQGAYAQQLPLRVLTLDNFEPFVWCEEKKAKGIDNDIVEEMARRVGITVTIKCVPWKRVMVSTKVGDCDGAFAAFKTPERESFAHFTTIPIHVSTFRVFVRKGAEFLFETIADLHGKKIGKIRGFSVSHAFDDAERAKKILVKDVTTLEQNIHKVRAGRIDGFVDNYHVTLYTLKQMGLLDQVVPLPIPLRDPRGAYFIISKAAPLDNVDDLVHRINQALHEMDTDGTIEQLTLQYIQ